jgi:hypothetical protein
MHRTPKKPAESREQLINHIMQESLRLDWSDGYLTNHLMKFFTDVDLKLILDDMKDVPAQRKGT